MRERERESEGDSEWEIKNEMKIGCGRGIDV